MISNKSKLTESAIRPKEVGFGSNVNDYNDSKVGLHAPTKSYFAVTFIEDEDSYLLVSISRETGVVSFTMTENAYVGRMLHVPAIFRRQNVRNALAFMPEVLYLMQQIITKFHTRIPRITLVASFSLLHRTIKFLIKSPAFKVALLRYRYKEYEFKEIDDEDGKRVIHTFHKQKLEDV